MTIAVRQGIIKHGQVQIRSVVEHQYTPGSLEENDLSGLLYTSQSVKVLESNTGEFQIYVIQIINNHYKQLLFL